MPGLPRTGRDAEADRLEPEPDRPAADLPVDCRPALDGCSGLACEGEHG